jgi:hypothetical protein
MHMRNSPKDREKSKEDSKQTFRLSTNVRKTLLRVPQLLQMVRMMKLTILKNQELTYAHI